MDSLPDHLLVEIFEYLDAKNIKRVEKVSERWKQLIISSSRIMRKFTVLSYEQRDDGLSFDDSLSLEENRTQQVADQFDKLEEEMKQHSYRNIVIMFPDSSLTPKDKYLGIVSSCFTRIEKIKLVSPDNYLAMRTLSLISPTLSELKFHPVDDNNFDDIQPVLLPKLKSLEIRKSLKILKYIKTPNLKQLVLDNCKNEDQILEGFLHGCKNLKKLTIEAEFCLNLTQVPFNLEYLEVMYTKDPNFLTPFKNFVIPHQNSLKILKIAQKTADCKEILAFAIENLKLETFECSGNLYVNEDSEMLDTMSENSTIKYLNIGFKAFNRDSLVRLDNMDNELKIIRKCSKLKTIKIDYLNGKFENFVKEIQDCSFRNFEVKFGNSVEPTEVKYEKLETLSGIRIGYETGIRGLVNFTAAFPNIKKLSLEQLTINNYADYFDRIFRTCSKLEEIEIKKLVGSAEELYESLQSEHCQLTQLKIGTTRISEARKIEEKFKDAPYKVTVFSSADLKKVEWDKFFNSYELCIYDDDDY